MNLSTLNKYWQVIREFYTVSWSAYKNGNNLDILKRNSELRNQYDGKRIILIFTGTSVDNIDFKLLSKEYVMGCNLLALHKDFTDLKVSFYTELDTWSYRIFYYHNWLLEIIYAKTQPGSKLFLSASSYDLVKSIPRFRKDDTYYLGFNSRFDRVEDVSIDIEKMTNVITCGSFSSSIALAIYLGFKTIYLVGADYAKDPIISGHFYDGVKIETQPGDEMIKNHEIINEFAEKRGVSIFNVVDQGFTSRTFKPVGIAEFIKMLR